ncbi:MAG TPA: hypothetical protein PKW62_05410 [Chitinophagaceae bacterium]|nr:hypothetical protein [Chitinophagaceae bacterium]HQV06176.1 hypothetical protein [Chitinophagaceae bacterium]
MRYFFLSVFLISCLPNIYAQKKGKEVAISNSGCTVEVICFPGRFDVYDMYDGATVYADDCLKDDIYYGIYCIKFRNPIISLDAAEDSTIAYLDFLKLDLGIHKAKGYDKGHHLHGDKNTRGVFDTWEDLEKNEWKVRAWTNRQFICILHMHSDKELPDKKVDIFLNGLQFPDKN